MQVPVRFVLYAIIISAALGASIAKIYFPDVRTEVKQVEVAKNDIVTVERVIVHKDGTNETVRTVTDKSVKNSLRSEIVTSTKENYIVGMSARASSYGAKPVYAITASMRVMGPFWAGVLIDTDRQVGLTLSYSF